MLQNFALGKEDEEVIRTLHHFAKTMEEVRETPHASVSARLWGFQYIP